MTNDPWKRHKSPACPAQSHTRGRLAPDLGRTNGARYAEAGVLISQGNLADAQELIESMPHNDEEEEDPEEYVLQPEEEDERERMLVYIGVLRDAMDEERNMYQLEPSEVEELEEMVGTNYDRPANWASNLLCAVYGICREPYTGEGGEPRSSMVPPIPDRKMETSSMFSVQPNPARTWAAFNYERTDPSAEQGRIIVRELSGRVLVTLPMNGPIGQELWDTRGTAPGTYLVEYRAGERLLHTERLVIHQ